jgi:acyl phosphate:glycerol-3-phosphate acyltransferase
VLALKKAGKFNSRLCNVSIRVGTTSESNCRMEWIEQLQSVDWFRATGCAAGAYFLGCLATGYYLVRFRVDRDIREVGSGSTGARNVGRVLGKSGFALTVLGDFGKGVLAVFLAREFSNKNQLICALAMVAVVAGHIWPLQLKFHGGKGVATALGALLMFDSRPALTFAFLFLVGFCALRRTFLPAMFGFLCLPAAVFWFSRDVLSAALSALLTVIILFAHRRNFSQEINLFRHSAKSEL